MFATKPPAQLSCGCPRNEYWDLRDCDTLGDTVTAQIWVILTPRGARLGGKENTSWHYGIPPTDAVEGLVIINACG